MAYMDGKLNSNEKVVKEAKVSWAGLVEGIVYIGLVIAVVVIFGSIISKIGEAVANASKDNGADSFNFNFLTLLVALMALLNIIVIASKKIIPLLTIKLVLTDRRLIGKRNLIKVHTLDAPLTKIDSVEIQYSVWGRLLKYATVNVKTTSSQTKFPFIAKPEEFRKFVVEAIETQKQQEQIKQAEEMAKAFKQSQV